MGITSHVDNDSSDVLFLPMSKGLFIDRATIAMTFVHAAHILWPTCEPL